MSYFCCNIFFIKFNPMLLFISLTLSVPIPDEGVKGLKLVKLVFVLILLSEMLGAEKLKFNPLK